MQTPIIYNEDTIIEAGNYYSDMPNDDYHAHSSVSKSGLDLIDRSPFHYFNNKPREQTRPMQVGSAIHAAILEPEVFAEEFIMLPEVKNRQQPEYKQAVKSFGVGNVFTGQDCENIGNIQKAVWSNDEAKELLGTSEYFELSGFVADPVTGVLCRHRFDSLNIKHNTAVDVKKTQDIRSEEFAKSIFNYRYHVQAAFYIDQYFWLTGEHLDAFKFVCVEEKAPHKVAVFYLDDVSINIGREEYRKNLNQYAHYLKHKEQVNNNAPAEMIALPEWVLRKYEDQEII